MLSERFIEGEIVALLHIRLRHHLPIGAFDHFLMIKDYDDAATRFILTEQRLAC